MDGLTSSTIPEAGRTSACRCGVSLMTTLGVIEGDVLIHLDEYGPATMRELIHGLDWPSALVTMAVGALVRQSLVRAVCQGSDVLIVDVGPERPIRYWPKEKRSPESWGCCCGTVHDGD